VLALETRVLDGRASCGKRVRSLTSFPNGIGVLEWEKPRKQREKTYNTAARAMEWIRLIKVGFTSTNLRRSETMRVLFV
jgi:hypothetical protein